MLLVKPVTVPLVHHKPHVVCLAMRTEQTPLPNIMGMLLEITHILSITKYIAYLIVYLRNTSTQRIMKQSDFWGYFDKKLHLMRREMRLIAICRIKVITSHNYSPAKKSLFCLLKLLTTDCESKRNCGNSPVRMRYGP